MPKKFPKEFWGFLLSQFFALVSDRMTTLALVTAAAVAWPRYAGTASTMVGVVQVALLVLMAYPGGWLSDQYPRNRLMGLVNLSRSLMLGGLCATLYFFPTGAFQALVLLVVLCLGTLAGVFNPAKRSYPPFLVSGPALVQANWWIALSEIIAMGLGLVVGAFLLRVVPVFAVLAIASLGFFVAWISQWRATPKDRAGKSTDVLPLSWQAAKDLWHKSPALRFAIWRLSVPYYACAGALYAGIGLRAAKASPLNPGALTGEWLAAIAFGAALSYGVRNPVEGLGRLRGAILSAGWLMIGALCLLLHAVTWPTSSSSDLQVGLMVLLVFTGMGVGLSYVRTSLWVQTACDPKDTGRGVSLNEVLGALSFVVVAGVLSVLADEHVAWSMAVFVGILMCVSLFRARKLGDRL